MTFTSLIFKKISRNSLEIKT